MREEIVVGAADEQAPPPSSDQEIDTKNLPVTINEEGNKVLSFYCIDMCEDTYKKPGTVYMFGKIAMQPNVYVRLDAVPTLYILCNM